MSEQVLMQQELRALGRQMVRLALWASRLHRQLRHLERAARRRAHCAAGEPPVLRLGPGGDYVRDIREEELA